jgi:pimeloyl-ACP methyl ester carboxylesterase
MYFLQVVKARGDVADALARYCMGLGPVEVAFIAHSLGCRVVLETVERLAAVQNNAVKVTGAVFMAGAVPVQYLLPFGRLRDAARAIERRYCFYSYLDAVLMLAFPPGQALAGELAPFATGFAGWPKRVWHGHRHTGFGHGGYWKGAMTVPANEAVASVLSGMFLVAANHVLPANAPPPEGPIEETFLPWSRLQERRLQGADWLEDLCAPTRTTLAR